MNSIQAAWAFAIRSASVALLAVLLTSCCSGGGESHDEFVAEAYERIARLQLVLQECARDHGRVPADIAELEKLGYNVAFLNNASGDSCSCLWGKDAYKWTNAEVADRNLVRCTIFVQGAGRINQPERVEIEYTGSTLRRSVRRASAS